LYWKIRVRGRGKGEHNMTALERVSQSPNSAS
jgi:hypothetical protein